ncbi:MAG: asparagine synthase (glutamine-hydrolyzing) [Flavobacteriales bacterium]|nr:asparagine synthase (glutamine-hydrolyzing) [Flavobacteriales bacterium]
MCGISGIISFQPNNKLVKSISSVNDEIKHRGPDDEGYVFFEHNTPTPVFGKDTPNNVKQSNLLYTPKTGIEGFNSNANVVLGHRRLSILDLTEHAHQPLCNEDGNYWIAFNGEIYNYQTIRAELIGLGYAFTSTSDTEVVLKAYMAWGAACLNKFNGMWSFVIYNTATQQLFGARDRFGVKPFYYIHNNNYFAFCSEIKGLLKLDGFEKTINPKAVYDYLVLGKMEIDAETFFKGIFELKPATYFELDVTTKKFTTHNYYQLNTNTHWEKVNKNTSARYIADLKTKITNAIALRLNSDAKTGTCLSGGIDSSIVVGTINELLKQHEIQQIGEKQEVFTASYPNNAIDESRWAKLVVEQTNTNWNQTKPTAVELQQQLEDLVYAQDIPFGSSSTFSQYKVMELIHNKNVKVTLDGQGADELFGGYANHFTNWMTNAFKSFSFSAIRNNLNNAHPSFANRKNVVKLPLQKFVIQNFQPFYFKKFKQHEPELAFVNKGLITANNKRFGFINDKIKSTLNGLLHYQFTEYGLKHLLRTADRNSMRFSVESRMPFADDIDLIETVFNISGSYKIQHGKSKFLLREAMKDVLPSEIYNRTDKIGFATPEKKWMQELKPYFKEIISQQKNDEYVNWEDFYQNFDAIYDNALNTSTLRLWRFINFALWRKVYQV